MELGTPRSVCTVLFFFPVLFLIFKQVILKVFRIGVSQDDDRIKG